jgi:beta-glucosidase-like glycosyl hydrolase
MLIVVGDLERQRATHAALLAALTDGTLSRERITAAVRNVLAVKARFGLLGGDPRPEPGCGG